VRITARFADSRPFCPVSRAPDCRASPVGRFFAVLLAPGGGLALFVPGRRGAAGSARAISSRLHGGDDRGVRRRHRDGRPARRRGERRCARIWTPRRAARHAARVPGVPVRDWIRRSRSCTCRGLAMDLSWTCRIPAPVTCRITRLRCPACGRCGPGARSADVDLALESGAFHSVAPRYRPDQDRGVGSGHLNSHGTRQLDRCARRLRVRCSVRFYSSISYRDVP
jgi:hypothetical protein